MDYSLTEYLLPEVHGREEAALFGQRKWLYWVDYMAV